MREPLVSIRGYCDLLHGGAMGPVNDEQRRGLQVCLRNVDKLLAAIEETVSFADASVPDYVAVKPIVLNECLEDAVVTVLPKAIAKRVKVSFDADRQRALEDTRHWAALALSPEEKMSVEDPAEMERLADALPLERAASRWICASRP